MITVHVLTTTFTAITAIVLLAGISHAQFTSQNITFSKSNFDQSLIDAVEPNVMGYQYVLIRNGRIVSERARGRAQNAADIENKPIPAADEHHLGGLKMKTSTPINVGSLAKFLSGTAMLHLMEKPAGPGGSWDAGQTLPQKLNRTFTTMVPDVWRTGLSHPLINLITLRQLLQHRSGFDDAKQGNRNVLGFLKDDDGFLVSQYDDREYSNVNFVLTGYLITMYEHPGAKDFYNLVTAGMNESDADKLVRDHAGMSMHYIMKDRIWDNMSPTILPNCDAANTLQNSAAYGYNSNVQATNGVITSSIDKDDHCKGQGGYYLSARDMANYLAHFSNTDLIVTSEARDLMYKDSMPDRNDRLVWTSASPNNWMADNFNVPNIVSSNGIVNGYRSVIIRFPQNYYLVLLTNSEDLSAGQLLTAGIDAFKAGMEHNFD
jgi:CubicO group peptidase (beta-lactamase class C family)